MATEERRLTEEELAEEAQYWIDHLGKEEAPPRRGAPLRLSDRTWAVIEEFARREGVSPDVLVRRWVVERTRLEAEKFLARGKEP